MLTLNRQEPEAKTVLIIDDEDMNFYSLAALLKSRGYQCISASNSAEAFSVLQKIATVDFILMDIMMPGIDGYEATAAIRSYPKFQSIPISALTNKEEVQKAYEAGADADLTKPVDFDKLMGLLQSHTR